MSEPTPSVTRILEKKPTSWAILIACVALAISLLTLFASCAPSLHQAHVDAKLRQHQVGMTATFSTALNGPPTRVVPIPASGVATPGFYPAPPTAIPGTKYAHIYEYWNIVTCVVEYYDENDRILFVHVGRT